MTCSPKTQVGCTFSYKGTIAIAIHLREKGITQHQCQVPGGPQSRPQQLRRERISRYHKGRFLAIKEELHGTRIRHYPHLLWKLKELTALYEFLAAKIKGC